MKLGAFSVSLAVKDLAASRDFYTKLGFTVTGGDEKTWAILVHGSTVIVLFEGMFESNILTFNPGWLGPGENDPDFSDVRELKRQLEAAGVPITEDQTTATESGPAHLRLVDPDGNDILIDQHV